MSKQRFNSSSGFSLIELLVIVSIVGILAGIAVSSLSRTQSVDARLTEQYELAFAHTQGAILDAQATGYKQRLWLETAGVYQQQSTNFDSACETSMRSSSIVALNGTEVQGDYEVQVFQCSLSSDTCDVEVTSQGLCIQADATLMNPYVVRFQSQNLSRHFTVYSTGLVARGLNISSSGNAEGVLIQ